MNKACKVIVNNKGQQTAEFLLMLGSIVAFILAFTISFHKELAGGFFTIIGNILS
ncbi:MAG: hypothetical protein J6S61_04835 [Elusimicrobiaceae bacterium]|nr:hypothetical protein [Elusimicrobiaceae bacterium]